MLRKAFAALPGITDSLLPGPGVGITGIYHEIGWLPLRQGLARYRDGCCAKCIAGKNRCTTGTVSKRHNHQVRPARALDTRRSGAETKPGNR